MHFKIYGFEFKNYHLQLNFIADFCNGVKQTGGWVEWRYVNNISVVIHGTNR